VEKKRGEMLQGRIRVRYKEIWKEGSSSKNLGRGEEEVSFLWGRRKELYCLNRGEMAGKKSFPAGEG